MLELYDCILSAFNDMFQNEIEAIYRIQKNIEKEKNKKILREWRKDMYKKPEICVKKCLNKKNNTHYYRAYVDLGYRKITISFDRCVCAELLNVSVAELDEYIEIEPP